MAKHNQNNNASSFSADEREQIVFHRNYDPMNYDNGGICKFDKLSLSDIKSLIEKGYIDPNEEINCSPTPKEFVEFVEQHDPGNWIFHGYVVSPYRDDRRITIEGLQSVGPLSKDGLIDFLTYFRYADELNCERGKPVWCWYD